MRTIMKALNTITKVRNRVTNEVFFTHPSWPNKDVDGVKFMTVSKVDPRHTMSRDQRLPPTFLIRSDTVNKID